MAIRLHKSFGRDLAVASVVFLSALSLFTSLASALNLGTLLNQESAVASPGESVSFGLLLWSADNKQFNVSFESAAENGWVVMFNPAQVALPVVKSEQYVGNTPVAVENIFVSVPKDAKPGNHTVNVTAYAGSEGYPIAMLPARSFFMNINVTGQETKHKDNVPFQSTNTTDKLQEVKSNGGVPFILVLLAVLAVPAVSYLIYRRK